jgi:hypothetical protein
MAVIGLILEQQSVRLRDIGKSGSFDKLKEFWDIVENFAGESKGGTVSNRIKFMLQDLLEMRDNGECMIIYRYYSRRRFIFTFS